MAFMLLATAEAKKPMLFSLRIETFFFVVIVQTLTKELIYCSNHKLCYRIFVDQFYGRMRVKDKEQI